VPRRRRLVASVSAIHWGRMLAPTPTMGFASGRAVRCALVCANRSGHHHGDSAISVIEDETTTVAIPLPTRRLELAPADPYPPSPASPTRRLQAGELRSPAAIVSAKIRSDQVVRAAQCGSK